MRFSLIVLVGSFQPVWFGIGWFHFHECCLIQYNLWFVVDSRVASLGAACDGGGILTEENLNFCVLKGRSQAGNLEVRGRSRA